MPNVATAGSARGNAILKNICNLLQPSIVEASSSSFGKDKKCWRIIKMPNPPNIPGKIRAGKLFTKCSSLIRKNSGIMFTCGGINIVISIIKNIKSRPLNCIRAKAYPAKVETKICPMVVKIDTKQLLKKYFPTGIVFATSE